MTTKLQLLLEKEAQLKAQIQLAKAAERTLEKKKDTRRNPHRGGGLSQGRGRDVAAAGFEGDDGWLFDAAS
jgi:hypothetical protein